MSFKINLPTRRECIIFSLISASYLLLTAVFIGLRPEHVIMLGVYAILFATTRSTRKLAVGLLPFLIFGISYDWMRVFPNYLVNTIDVEHLYNLEKRLFGVVVDGQRLTLCEFFTENHHPFLDLLAGIFYFGWVPIPFGIAIYLYFRGDMDNFLRFGIVFLLVNFIGFIGYYIYPAAPPWYALQYGFQPILDTPGNMAGLARFDELIGFPLFGSIYGRNANVFAAVPSLHSAYLVVTLYYALRHKIGVFLKVFIVLFMMGIWFTAVYTSHHYVIDVLLGVICAILGILLFEKVMMKSSSIRLTYQHYLEYVA